MTQQTDVQLNAPRTYVFQAKRTAQERESMKRLKKEWAKNMKKLDPTFKGKRGCLGLRTDDVRQLQTILNMAEIVQVEKRSQLESSM